MDCDLSIRFLYKNNWKCEAKYLVFNEGKNLKRKWSDKVQIHKEKKLLNINRLFLINTFLLIVLYCIFLFFKENILAFLLLSLLFVVVVDVLFDFLLWIRNFIKESWYKKYIEYYRRFLFWFIVGPALLVDSVRTKAFFSIRGLFALGLFFFISLIYLTITHKCLSNYKEYINKEIQTYRYLHYMDSILWLSLFCLIGLFNSYILYIFIFRHICILILEIFKYKGKVSKEKYVANTTHANWFTLVLIFFSLIYRLNTMYISFPELAGTFFLFFTIKIIGVKQPQQIFPERIYTDKEKEGAVKSKYHKKGFPKQYPGALNSYLMKVMPTGAHYFTCRVDSKNTAEILPVLNIPNETKNEIKNTVEKGKVVFVSEAAFDPKWVWDAKYLIWDEKNEMLYEKGEKGINIADKVAPVLRRKYKIRDLYRNPGLVLSPDDICILREYYFNVRALNAPQGKGVICRVDCNNLTELLPILRISKRDKTEIKKLIKENKKNVVIISEAVYTKKWNYDKRYLVFEVDEADRIKSFSGFNKKKLIIKYEATPFSLTHNTVLISPEKCIQRFTDYKKKFDTLKPDFKLFGILKINENNASELLPMLYIPSKVKKKVKKLVKENKIVIVTEAAFQPEWKWEEKYLVFDKKKT